MTLFPVPCILTVPCIVPMYWARLEGVTGGEGEGDILFLFWSGGGGWWWFGPCGGWVALPLMMMMIGGDDDHDDDDDIDDCGDD